MAAALLQSATLYHCKSSLIIYSRTSSSTLKWNNKLLVAGKRGRNYKAVRSSLGTVGKVTEVGNDTFWPIVNATGEKTIVLDMYTQWCGPCNIIAPKYQELSKKYDDVIFLKLDCNQQKALAKKLGIRVVPTFKILKNDKVVKEVTGAKFDDLVAAIETVRTT